MPMAGKVGKRSPTLLPSTRPPLPCGASPSQRSSAALDDLWRRGYFRQVVSTAADCLCSAAPA